MKIVFSPAALNPEELSEALTPGGTVSIIPRNDLLREVAAVLPDVIVITANSLEREHFSRLRHLSPDSFIILAGNSFDPEETTHLFNSGLIDIRMEATTTERDFHAVKKAFWGHFYAIKKRIQAENLTEYFISRMKFLHQISLKILENKPLNVLLDEIMTSGRAVLNAEKSSFMLYDPNDNKLHFHVLAEAEEARIKDQPLDIGTGIAGWVAKHRVAQLVDDCYHDSRFNPAYDKMSGFRTKSMVCAPILKNETLYGVLSVINKKDSTPFVVEDIQLIETLAGQCAVAIENALLLETKVKSEALKQELEMAQKIQQRLLPAVLPSFPCLDLAARLIPAEEVGGDYYTIRKPGTDHCLLVVADVSGKGIPAALLVSTLDATLLTMIKLGDSLSDAAAITGTINSVLCETTTSEKFVTSWIGIIDLRSMTLQSVNAGHNDPILFKASTGEVIRLKKGGIFLGVLPFDYVEESTQLDPGDVLVFFSDGVIEAMDSNLNIYSDHRLMNMVLEFKSLSAAEMTERIIGDVKLHAKDAKQSDDITLCVVKAL